MYPLLKRITDILISAITLIVLLPFFIPLAILLLLTGEGEIWYWQKRVGYKKQDFNILKFATMLKNSPNMGTGSNTIKDDPRVTPMGKYLRKSKINELPQFINVFIGNMSVVGPRPQMKVDFEAYPQHIQDKIYNVKPGITSIGSIIFRDEEEIFANSQKTVKETYAEDIAPYKGELELWYQNKAGWLNDIKVVLLTAWVVFFPDSKIIESIFPDMPQPNNIV